MSENHMHKCNKCRVEFEIGATICRGCKRPIVYQATDDEIINAAKLGGFCGIILSLLSIYILPNYLNNWFNFEIEPAWGLVKLDVIQPIIIGGVIGAILSVVMIYTSLSHKIRTL